MQPLSTQVSLAWFDNNNLRTEMWKSGGEVGAWKCLYTFIILRGWYRIQHKEGSARKGLSTKYLIRKIRGGKPGYIYQLLFGAVFGGICRVEHYHIVEMFRFYYACFYVYSVLRALFITMAIILGIINSVFTEEARSSLRVGCTQYMSKVVRFLNKRNTLVSTHLKYPYSKRKFTNLLSSFLLLFILRSMSLFLQIL